MEFPSCTRAKPSLFIVAVPHTYLAKGDLITFVAGFTREWPPYMDFSVPDSSGVSVPASVNYHMHFCV